VPLFRLAGDREFFEKMRLGCFLGVQFVRIIDFLRVYVGLLPLCVRVELELFLGRLVGG